MTLLTESVFGLLLLNRILVEFIVVVNQSIYLAYAKRNNCGKMELIEIDAGLLCIAVAAQHTHTNTMILIHLNAHKACIPHICTESTMHSITAHAHSHTDHVSF